MCWVVLTALAKVSLGLVMAKGPFMLRVLRRTLPCDSCSQGKYCVRVDLHRRTLASRARVGGRCEGPTLCQTRMLPGQCRYPGSSTYALS